VFKGWPTSGQHGFKSVDQKWIIPTELPGGRDYPEIRGACWKIEYGWSISSFFSPIKYTASPGSGQGWYVYNLPAICQGRKKWVVILGMDLDGIVWFSCWRASRGSQDERNNCMVEFVL